jgi:hypothetical protein
VKDFGALEIVGKTQIGDLTKLTTLFAAGWIAGRTCSADDLSITVNHVSSRIQLIDLPASQEGYRFAGQVHRFVPVSSMHNGTLE